MNIDDIFEYPFTFSKRKNFTSCESRPLWKASLIVLILGLVGRESKATLQKVHVANWIVKKNSHLESFLDWNGKNERKRPNVRLEPAIDSIINILISNGIVVKSDGKVGLTDSGLKFFDELNLDNVFSVEKDALRKSKRYLSEASVKRLFEGV